MKYEYTLEEYQHVMFVLRHKCHHVKNVNRAIEIIKDETGYSEHKVRTILTEMFKD